MLAHEYGWDIDRILYRVTIPELFILTEKINIRHIREQKQNLINYQNPHTKEPQKLFDLLEEREKSLLSPNATIEQKAPEFDAAGFEILKQRMQSNPHMIVKP